MMKLCAGEAEMDTTYQLPQTTRIGGADKALTLREIIKRLEVMNACVMLGIDDNQWRSYRSLGVKIPFVANVTSSLVTFIRILQKLYFIYSI